MNNKVRLGILLIVLAIAGVAGSDSAKRSELRDAISGYGPQSGWLTPDVLRYLSFGVGAVGLALLIAGLQQPKTVFLLPPDQRTQTDGTATCGDGGGVGPPQYPTFATMSQKPLVLKSGAPTALPSRDLLMAVRAASASVSSAFPSDELLAVAVGFLHESKGIYATKVYIDNTGVGIRDAQKRIAELQDILIKLP